MSEITQAQVNATSDYNRRTVSIEVTGVRRQNVIRRSNYTVKVPYSRMSQAMQNIYRMGGQVVSVRIGSFSPSEKKVALPDVFPQLKNKNPKLREKAMREIAENKTEETIPQLMAILSDEDVVYRRAAVQTLGVIGLDAVSALAEQLRNSNNATVRASCAKALAAIALEFPEESFPTVALEALQTALHDSDPVVKLATIGALGTVGTPAFEILVKAVEIDDIALQVAAIGALGSLGDVRAAEALSALGSNPDADPYIRESIASSLSRLEQTMQMKAKLAQMRSQPT